MNQTINKQYFNMFPTLNLGYETKKQFNYNLSYTRRIEYPDYALNPFKSYQYEEVVYFGNPDLNPAFTHAFEGGFAKFFENGSSINLSLYYRRTKNEINDYSYSTYDTLLQKTTVYSTYLNSGFNHFSGSEITFNYSFLKKYRAMLNVDFYYYDIEAELGNYKIDKEDFSYNTKLILNANYKYFRLNATGNYRSGGMQLLGEKKPIYYINLSASADFFDRKLSLRVGAQDIFNWQKNDETVSTPTLISVRHNKNMSQYFTFGIIYKFGKTELESKAKNVNAPMGN